MALIEDEELCRLWLSGSQGPGKLSPEASVRYATLLIQVFNTFESLYFQAQNGTIDDSFFQAKVTAYRAMLALPGIRAWWQGAQETYDSRFREFVRAEVEPRAV
jgi:hypothetical protein